MGYCEPEKPTDLVKNPQTILQILSNEVVEHASSVVHIYQLAPHLLTQYKKLCFEAARKLNEASDLLLKNVSVPTQIVIDKTEGQKGFGWIWVNIARPVLVGAGVLSIFFLGLPFLSQKLLNLFLELRALFNM